MSHPTHSFAGAADAAFPFFPAAQPTQPSPTPNRPVENRSDRAAILDRFPQLKVSGDFQPIGDASLNLLGQTFVVRFHRLPEYRPRNRTSSVDMIMPIEQRFRNESSVSMHSDTFPHLTSDFQIVEMPTSGVVLEFLEDRPQKLFWLPPENLNLKIVTKVEPYECKGSMCLLADSDIRIGHTYHPAGDESPTVPHFELVHVNVIVSGLTVVLWRHLKHVMASDIVDGYNGMSETPNRQMSGQSSGSRGRADMDIDEGMGSWIPEPEDLFPAPVAPPSVNRNRGMRPQQNIATPPRFPTSANEPTDDMPTVTVAGSLPWGPAQNEMVLKPPPPENSPIAHSAPLPSGFRDSHRTYSHEYSLRRCQNANCPNGPDFIEPYGYRPGPEGRGTLCGTCARKFRRGKLTNYVSKREQTATGQVPPTHGRLALPVGDRMKPKGSGKRKKDTYYM